MHQFPVFNDMMRLMMTISLSVLLTCTLFIPPSTHAASGLNFTFPSFSPNDHNIIYDGSASASDEVILLTSYQKDRMYNDTGRATYKQQMHLWDKETGNLANFTTSFSFLIKPIDEKHESLNRSQVPDSYPEIGDGLTFFLASNISALSSLNAGGGLGIGINTDQDGTSSSKEFRFIAIEFDTNQNAWDLENGPHVGIDDNSLMSVRRVQWIGEDEIVRGEQRAEIAYNGVSKTLSVSFTNSSRDGDGDGIGRFNYTIDLGKLQAEFVTIGFSASTGTVTEQNIISSWSFSSSINISDEGSEYNNGRNRNPRHHHLSKKGLAGLIVGGFFVIGFLLIFLAGIIKKRREGEKISRFSIVNSVLCDEIGSGGFGPMQFSYKQLSRATTNFAETKKLGQGGFGSVYFGFLRDLNLHVAIKRVSRTSNQGIKEYASEVKIISKLRHKNLVKLVGWCHEKNDLLLAYELLPNGSLDRFLFSKTDLLTWDLRYKVATGLASALLYLHEEWEQCVLHRDVKSSNVMLDKGFNAKLGDFGLARLVDHEKGAQTTTLAGTMGYIAPESVLTGKASKETDIYSFGIVALEIACGRKPIEPRAEPDKVLLVDWVWELYGSGTILGAADPKLCSIFDEQEMQSLITVGLWSAHPDYSQRPSIQQVVRVLKFESPLPVLPSKMPVATYPASTPVSNASLPTSSFSFSIGATSSFSS
ncbi:PREDICTED: L-type lectin-domain containing receptor kinase IX.1-like [Ipomoea nil]|uniref:L-type lectin-domain containing receptor kinase IX.1-like n=1 Tax=Ipomoea nil TaxID=35883 RepID=UPI000901A13D|nr:PREDICTED: L-type lectin-domain containing receptor kinase IX.1-like [Ipomoea nil]